MPIKLKFHLFVENIQSSVIGQSLIFPNHFTPQSYHYRIFSMNLSREKMASLAGFGFVTLGSIVLNIYFFSYSKNTASLLTTKNEALKQTKTGLDERLAKLKSSDPAKLAKLELDQIRKEVDDKTKKLRGLEDRNQSLNLEVGNLSTDLTGQKALRRFRRDWNSKSP